MNSEKRVKVLLITLFISLVFIILLIYFYTSIQKQHIVKSLVNESYCSLYNNDTVLSFEIDDISFSRYDLPILENALFLAKKYGITFDLGVIANQFNETMDNNVFNLYQDNQNYFEVVAHGFNHKLDQSIIDEYPNNNVYGEFYVFSADTSVPSDIQEYHIKNMKQIFEEYNLTTATQIFTVPYHTGDFNTISLAAKYGYKLIIQKITTPQTFSEIYFGNITNSQDYIDIPQQFNKINQSQIVSYTDRVNEAIKEGQKRIDITLHTINFGNLTDINSFFNQSLTTIKENNPKVRFDFLSDRFRC